MYLELNFSAEKCYTQEHLEECHEFFYQKIQACSCMYSDLFSSPDATLDCSKQHRTYNLTNKTHESKLVQLSIVGQIAYIYIHPSPINSKFQLHFYGL
jgi:hypothetical protein